MKFKLICLLFSLCFLVGCENTIQGFGKDMQHAGEKIQDSNQDTSQK